MRVGLRIDVDTFRGTRDGVPNLLRQLDRHGLRATFFFCVGPDNMGRHVWRLLRPRFLLKMLRTRAASLYGWDILLRGTFGPGPRIGPRLAAPLRDAARAGHEIGLHAWDHYRWQSRLDGMTAATIRAEIARGMEALGEMIGTAPTCTAAPAWKCNAETLLAKEAYALRYNSDCRGGSIFQPRVHDRVLAQPQIPATLPTYDEMVGRRGVTRANYNDRILARLRPGALNVLTLHAEAEGLAAQDLFEDFLARARAQGVAFGALGDELAGATAWPADELIARTVPGREGWAAWQRSATPWEDVA